MADDKKFAGYICTGCGLGERLEPDHPGVHTTATIDCEFVVSGRCVLEIDNGATRELGPGDTVIQNGTRHAWRNPFDEPCLMVVALVGAHQDGGAKPLECAEQDEHVDRDRKRAEGRAQGEQAVPQHENPPLPP